MKLRIEIQGKGDLDLSPDTKIPIRMMNPLFNELGSYSFSFGLPITDNNLRILNYLNKVERFSYEQSLESFRCYFDGRFLFAGELSSEYSGGNITTFFKIESGNILNKMKDYPLAYIYLGEWPWYFDDYSLSIDLKSVDYGNYIVAPFENDGAVSNNLSVDESKKVMIGNTDVIYIFPNDKYVFWRVDYIIKKIFEHFKINFRNDFFEKYEYMKKIVLHNQHIMQGGVESVTMTNYSCDKFIKDIKAFFNLEIFLENGLYTLKNVWEVLNSDETIKIETATITSIDRTKLKGINLSMQLDESDAVFTTNNENRGSFDAKYYKGETNNLYTYNSDKDIFLLTTDQHLYQNSVKKGIGGSIAKLDCGPNNLFIDDPAGETKETGLSVVMETEKQINYSLDIDFDYLGVHHLNMSFTVRMPESKFTPNDPDIMPRLYFYHGLITAKDINYNFDNITYNDLSSYGQQWFDNLCKYPLISQMSVNHEGWNIPACPFSLDFNANTGVVKNFHEKTNYWQKHFKIPIEGVLIMDEKQLSEFAFSKKYMIENTRIIMSELSYNLEAESISDIKWTGFKV